MADEVEGVVKEILDALIPSFEAMEAQNGAVLQFLKEKGIATEEQLAPYIEQASNASNIRWLATRLRLEHLFTSAMKGAQRAAEKSSTRKDEKASAEPQTKKEEKPDEQGSEKSAQNIFGENNKKNDRKESTQEDQANPKDERQTAESLQGPKPEGHEKEEHPANSPKQEQKRHQSPTPESKTTTKDAA